MLNQVFQQEQTSAAKGQVLQTAHLNRLLEQARGTDHAEVVNMSTLRSMTQAYYNPENFGHFGLALKAYAHFTSPIRRYADLIVHRALITAHGWGSDGLTPFDTEVLAETAQKISDTERRSMTAERDTTDRYLAAFLSERLGAEMPGRISGVAKFGVFVKLDETGADALIPIRSLGDEYFDYDQESQTLMGSKTGIVIGLGVKVVVKLLEAAPVTGGLIAEIVTLDERTLPKGSNRGRGKPARRKFGSSKKKSAKIKKKVKRSRG